MTLGCFSFFLIIEFILGFTSTSEMFELHVLNVTEHVLENVREPREEALSWLR